jgi:hypothetical protein
VYDNIAIYRTANELLQQHGDDAPIHADIPAHFAMLISNGNRVLSIYSGT